MKLFTEFSQLQGAHYRASEVLLATPDQRAIYVSLVFPNLMVSDVDRMRTGTCGNLGHYHLV